MNAGVLKKKSFSSRSLTGQLVSISVLGRYRVCDLETPFRRSNVGIVCASTQSVPEQFVVTLRNSFPNRACVECDSS